MTGRGGEKPEGVGKAVGRVMIKALALFAALNLLYAWLNPTPWLAGVSLYNGLFPGRPRLPFGERPERAYNLSLLELPAMFASHEVDGEPKAEEKYRVFVLGDSGTWGFMLRNEETLSARLNEMGLRAADGRRMQFYNLGYPTISLTKDLLVLQQAMKYEPDAVIWLVTLEAFPQEKQLFTPLVQQNPAPVRALIEEYGLKTAADSPAFEEKNFWERTIVGQRRTLADLIRYQLYGVMWAATGIDQDLPEAYTPVMEDLEAETEYYGSQPGGALKDALAFDVLAAGGKMVGKRPLLIVNEPMFISRGENSDIRYNFYYPRWAYDEYRRLLAEECKTNGRACLDVWDAIPQEQFTNSAIHVNAEGMRTLAELVGSALLEMVDGGN